MKLLRNIIMPALIVAALCSLIASLDAVAFNGPSSAPGVGSGAIGVSSGNNLSIGTSTPLAGTKLLVQGSSTSASDYSFQVLDSSQNLLFGVRNDGTVYVGTSTLTGGSYTGSMAAGNILSGQFGSNYGGGNFSFPAALIATSGTVTLATTTINGNVTTTNISATSIVSALVLAASNGNFGEYGGASACAAGQAVTAISAVGGTTCAAFSRISTSTANTWTATQTFSSAAITQSGALVSLASTTVNGNTTTTNLGITSLAVTGSFGNVALGPGQCTSSTVAIAGSQTSGDVIATPQTYPGDPVYWKGYISVAGTAKVEVCAATGTTPTASKYNVVYIAP